MKTKKPFYTIVRSLKNRPFTWGYSVALNKDNTLHNVNNIRMLVTLRNYYFSHSDNKIHYQKMSSAGSSASFYADIYAEVYPGIFIFYSICSDSNFTDKLESAAIAAGEYKKAGEIDALLKSIALQN